LDVLIEVILPIFLVAGAGYLVGRLSGDDARQLRDLRSRGPSVRLRRGRFTLGVVYMLTSSLMQATPRCSAPTASSVRC